MRQCVSPILQVRLAPSVVVALRHTPTPRCFLGA